MKRLDHRSGLLRSWSGLVTVFFWSQDWTSKHYLDCHSSGEVGFLMLVSLKWAAVNEGMVVRAHLIGDEKLQWQHGWRKGRGWEGGLWWEEKKLRLTAWRQRHGASSRKKNRESCSKNEGVVTFVCSCELCQTIITAMNIGYRSHRLQWRSKVLHSHHVHHQNWSRDWKTHHIEISTCSNLSYMSI